MATIFDVARRANVSITTVSHVFSGKRTIASTTRERVLQAAKELNYTPSRAGQGLALRRSFTVAVLLPNPLQHCLVNPAFVELVLTITEECSLAGYSTLIFGITPGLVPNELCTAVEQRNIDGILWIDPAADGVALSAFLRGSGLPLVVGGTPPHPDRIVHVRNDRHEVARLAVDHLYALGHGDVGLVAGPQDLMVAPDYVLAFQEMTTDLGLRLSTTYTNGWTIRDGREALRALWDADERISGVVALNEAMAVGVMQAAHERGQRVPARLSVVSIGNTHLAEHFSPSITAIDVESRKIGQTLVTVLLGLIDGQSPPRDLITVPARLIVRDSTGSVWNRA